jgi:hypothetical protein
MLVFEACSRQHLTERKTLDADYDKERSWIEPPFSGNFFDTPSIFHAALWLTTKALEGIRVTAGLVGALEDLAAADCSQSMHLLGAAETVLFAWRRVMLLLLKGVQDGLSLLADPDRTIPSTTLGHEILAVAVWSVGLVTALPKAIWQTEGCESSVRESVEERRRERFVSVYRLPVFALNKRLRGEAIEAAWRILQRGDYYNEHRWRCESCRRRE